MLRSALRFWARVRSSLRRDAFERLYEYKVRNGIPSWEEVIERMFASTDEPVRM